MNKWKIKKCKKFYKIYSIYVSLTTFLDFACLIVISIFYLILAINISNKKISSIFSNIFAGLITGVAICQISGLRNLTNYKIQFQIKWLDNTYALYRNYGYIS